MTIGKENKDYLNAQRYFEEGNIAAETSIVSDLKSRLQGIEKKLSDVKTNRDIAFLCLEVVLISDILFALFRKSHMSGSMDMAVYFFSILEFSTALFFTIKNSLQSHTLSQIKAITSTDLHDHEVLLEEAERQHKKLLEQLTNIHL
jgi:hypothetical protein